MDTLFVTHPDCLKHDTGAGHPECADRLTAIEERLAVTHLLDYLTYRLAPDASDEQLQLAHTVEHISEATQPMPPEGHRHLDPDTMVSEGSELAARRAAGAVIHAIDEVMARRADAAFCSVRPPGHHANAHASSGFCVFNNIAIGAKHALSYPQIDRVAVIDFDVHHGNGTEDIIFDDPNIMFCSTLQHPFYPNTPLRPITDNMVSVPLALVRAATISAQRSNNIGCRPWNDSDPISY